MTSDNRLLQLSKWIFSQKDFCEKTFEINLLSGDASFRRYFRMKIDLPQLAKEYGNSLVLMDAPPEKEDCLPFINIAKILAAAKVNVPKIVFANNQEGFLALSDFGDITYEDYLGKDINSAEKLYQHAFRDLIKIQQAKNVLSESYEIPPYNNERMLSELSLFDQWFCKVHLQKQINSQEIANFYVELINRYNKSPKVLVHRDFHIRNLMVIVNDEGQIDNEKTPGVIDFQDAVIGPITYDAVSILKDAYINWDEEICLDWLIRYWENAKKAGLPVHQEFSDFYLDFDYMILLRHLKVLGIFSRLNYRDGKPRYLQYLPRVFNYCRNVANRYGDLKFLAKIFDEIEDKI